MPRTRLALIVAAAAALAAPTGAVAKPHGPKAHGHKPHAARTHAARPHVRRPAAASAPGTVLSVDGRQHLLRLVTPSHAVRSFAFRGALRPAVRAGSRVVLRVRGRRIEGVRVVAASRTLRFYGRVVSDSAKGLVLRLGDGRVYRIGGAKRSSAASARTAIVRAADTRAPQLTVNVEGLQPGQVVLVTLTVGAGGDVSVTVKLVGSPQPGSDPVSDGDGGDAIDDNGGDDYSVDGTVTALDPGNGTLTVQADSGTLTFAADGLLDGVQVGDDVSVDYYKDLTDNSLVADDVFDNTANATDDGSTGDGSANPVDDGSGDGSSLPVDDGSGTTDSGS